MQNLAHALETFLEAHFVQALRHDLDASVRPVLVGPPAGAMGTLFDLLTAGGTRNWSVQVPVGTQGAEAGALGVAVLLVEGASSPGGTSLSCLSARCQWDYAVTVRNSYPRVVILVDPTAWDNRHESLVNTTETLGTLDIDARGGRWLKDPLWRSIVSSIQGAVPVGAPEIEQTLKAVVAQSRELEPSARDLVPWQVAENILAGQIAGLTPGEALALACGFPRPAATLAGAPSPSPANLSKIIDLLGQLLAQQGLVEGMHKLQETDLARGNAAIGDAIRGLADHIKSSVLSGVDFDRAPSWYYRPATPSPPSWWSTLDANTLSQLLDDVLGVRPGKLTLRCEDALYNLAPGENVPWVVSSLVKLRTSAQGSQTLPALSYEREVDHVPLTAEPRDLSLCVDHACPPHDKPVRYKVVGADGSVGSTDVVVLDRFGCRGVVYVRDAARPRPPGLQRRTNSWAQEIRLPRGGPMDLVVYHASGTARVGIDERGTNNFTWQPVATETRTVIRVLGVENGDVIGVALEGLDTAGALWNTGWSMHFAVDEVTATARSYFAALVGAHQGNGAIAIAQPRDKPAQRLLSPEDPASYPGSPGSWKPVIACWSGSAAGAASIDWDDPRLGDIAPRANPAAGIVPPSPVLDAREGIRECLARAPRPLNQVNLGEETLVQRATSYLEAYLDWLRNEPQKAVWFDCIAVYASRANPQAGQRVATDEPVAIVLSPLHPLRLAWHCLAQGQLYDSRPHLCPAAGLLDPASCPDCGAWDVVQGGRAPGPRAFFAVACEDPHWSIMLNSRYIHDDQQGMLAQVLERLSDLGLAAAGVAEGFTVAQAKDSIDEITRLMPARATLRLGIVGASESSRACTEGVIEWCKERYRKDTDDARVAPPFAVEVYDLRGEETRDPGPETIADLSKATGERVKWFKVRNDEQMASVEQLDLIILDQLSTGGADGQRGESHSPVGPGALYRARIREDFQDATWLIESRIGRRVTEMGGLAGLMEQGTTLFEGLTTRNGDLSHFLFKANQDAIHERLGKSTFLAMTSAQVDPASISRGATGEDRYLWDYELPSAIDGHASGAGYYLIAIPSPAMYTAVENAARLIAPSPPDTRTLLAEVSQRGIPILKRLASGGPQSRGEMGMLLAARYLQDAFREDAPAPRLPVWDGDCIHLLLPVDPYEETFDKIRGKLLQDEPTTGQRPDLLVLALLAPTDGSRIEVRITPVEVKFRAAQMPIDQQEEALGQAANLGKVLKALWTRPGPAPLSPLWGICGMALLAQCLDFAFRVYASERVHGRLSSEWTRLHERVLGAILGEQAKVSVNGAGRLLVFDDSPVSDVVDRDNDWCRDTVVLCRADARVLLTDDGTLSAVAVSGVTSLDFSVPGCHTSPREPGGAPPPPPASSRSVDATGGTETAGEGGAEATKPPTTGERAREHVADGRATPAADRLAPIAGEPPRAVVGWTGSTSRWTLLGTLDGNGEPVALDLDHPKAMGILGYMGSGKSYMLGTIVEAAAEPIAGLNRLTSPLSVVIFNYRRNPDDRFELSSLALPNSKEADVRRLAVEYGAAPHPVRDILVLCLPGELTETRAQEYGGLPALELCFDPDTLTVEDWDLLMGETGSGALFARTIRHALVDMRAQGTITVDGLEERVSAMLTGQSRAAARLRFEFVRRYLSSGRGVRFDRVLKPGRVVVVDLRQPLFAKEDALRFFLVCANQVSRVQGRFNKLVVFDEAHEYMSDEFGDKIEARIRQMRHEGTSYVFATQDAESIPSSIRRFLTTRFVFDLGTRQNMEDLLRFAPEFRGYPLLGMPPGQCLVQTNRSTGGLFERPRTVTVRPRATQHGGGSRIFSGGP